MHRRIQLLRKVFQWLEVQANKLHIKYWFYLRLRRALDISEEIADLFNKIKTGK